MNTRDHIIRLGDELIRGRGYHAFSFADISAELKIRNASIHYYFPTKTNLGIAVVEKHIAELDKLMASVKGKNPLVQLKAFLSIYDHTRKGNRICVVGSLASSLTTVDTALAAALRGLTDKIILWLTRILEEGRAKKIFHYRSQPRTRALMLAATMLASVQLSRCTGSKDFELIREGVLQELNHTDI